MAERRNNHQAAPATTTTSPTSNNPAAGNEAEKPFAQEILDAINAVRENPQSIISAIQEQMNQVDEDKVLQVPDRDPIQLEEGKKSVSHL